MYLITVYDLHDRSYWTPILASSQHAVEQYSRQTFRNNKRILMRVDTVGNEHAIANLRQQGAKTLRYGLIRERPSYAKDYIEYWAWTAE